MMGVTIGLDTTGTIQSVLILAGSDRQEATVRGFLDRLEAFLDKKTAPGRGRRTEKKGVERG